MRENGGVTDDFLLQHVVPHIVTRFSVAVALVLAKPLLWLHFSEKANHLPEEMRNVVQTAHNAVRVLPVGENPVLKVPLVISGHEGEVRLDEIGGDG